MSTAALPGGLTTSVLPLAPDAVPVAAWRALADRALVANPFYEADYVLAAAQAFGAGIRLLVVSDRPPGEAGARLLALWPYRTSRTRWGVPLGVLAGWSHGFCPLGVPLLDRDEPARALDGLLSAPRALALPPRLLFLNAPAAGPFADLLDGRHGRSIATWSHARGLLDLDDLSAEDRAGYLAHMGAERRRKLRRGAARLEAGGPVALDYVSDPGALEAALDDYVALETAGWKGRAGTALGQRPAEAAFMRAMVAALSLRGRVKIHRLRRNGRTLASAILVRSSDEAFVLKISYDEAEAAGAPGVQLVHRLTQAVLAANALRSVDSCAAPDYRLAEMFWTGRRPIAHLLVEAAPDPLFPVAAAMERARERVSMWRARRRRAAIIASGAR